MKFLPQLVLVLTAVASGAAGAQAAMSDQADQDRRARNREEALANYHANADRSSGDTVRERTHKTAQSVRGFTHRQAQKARNFSDRQNRRYGTNTKPNPHPEGGK
jgi:hypothetical protein